MTRRIFCKVLLVVVAIFGLLVLSGVLMAQGSSEDAFERARGAQERNTEMLMAGPGVVGTAVGLNDDGRHVVLVLLEESGVAGIPNELDGVPVRVVVTGRIIALAHAAPPDPRARFPRPVPIGVSTGHPLITAGTIGCRVKKGGNVYALSNNHVYANQNLASLGDAVIQPGTVDHGSSPGDDIGTLSDFEWIDFYDPFNPPAVIPTNTIDAAIALSSTFELDNATPSDGYGVPRSGTVRARLFQNVKKYGRTTKLTVGYVGGVNVTVDVWYSETTIARFVKQIAIGSGGFSAGGDSGSLIVSSGGRNDGKAVGLLFAGGGDWTFANPIRPVLERFGVTIDDSEGPPPPSNDPPTVSITSPANGSTFASGATIDFSGTASDTEDGDLTSGLAWTSSINGSIGSGGSFFYILSDGNHTITASVTDLDGKPGSASVSITVGTPPAEATTVSVVSIDYATEGGKNKDKHLLITVALLDNLGDPVAGASVSIDLFRDDDLPAGSGSGTTGTDGTVTFTLNNAPSGHYKTTVTNVSAEGLIWIGGTPENGFTK